MKVSNKEKFIGRKNKEIKENYKESEKSAKIEVADVEKKMKSATVIITIKKKNLDGKDIVTFSVERSPMTVLPESAPTTKEYTDAESMMKTCLHPMISEISEELA